MLLAALPQDRSGIECIVVDGFVDLGEDQRAGLGPNAPKARKAKP